jgi:Uma2 family endonuclease
MSTTLQPPDLGPLPLDFYRMTVDEYERLAAAGILDDPRVELIDGYLVRKMTKKPRHVVVTERLRRLLDPIVPVGWHIRQEQPIRIPDFDEPEPDIAVVRGNLDDYASRHPGPSDVGLLIEVAEASLPRDQHQKLAAYARAAIPFFWIINLVDERVEVYSTSDPNTGHYQSRSDFARPDRVPISHLSRARAVNRWPSSTSATSLQLRAVRPAYSARRMVSARSQLREQPMPARQSKSWKQSSDGREERWRLCTLMLPTDSDWRKVRCTS